MDLFLELANLLWTIWPIMFLGALQGALKRNKRLASRRMSPLSHVLINLTFVWLVWLGMLLFLELNGRHPKPILPQVIFWLVGALLFAFYAWVELGERFRLKRTQGMDSLLSLSPEAFEELVAETYRAYGCQVQKVESQSDSTGDLVLTTPKGEKKVVQCKRLEGKGSLREISEPEVRDFYAALQHEGAVEGAIVTNGTFTPEARAWVRGKEIRLYDGEGFLEVVRKVG